MGDRSAAKHVPLTNGSNLAADRVCTRALAAWKGGLASTQPGVELPVSAEVPKDSGARNSLAQHSEYSFMPSVRERNLKTQAEVRRNTYQGQLWM